MKKINCALVIFVFFSLFLYPSCQDRQAKEDLLKYQQTEAKEKSNIEVVKQLYQLLDELNLESCNNLMAPDNKIYLNSEEAILFKELIPNIQIFYSAVPDYKHNIENIFAADDYVVAQLRYTGTFSNKFMQTEPNGNKIDYKGIFILKMTDGKIIEIWTVEDDLTRNKQMGL